MNTEINEKVGTIVLVMAKTQPDYTRPEIIKLSKDIDPIVDEFDGYFGRKMTFSTKEPDLLADIVFYQDVQSFEKASEIEMKSEICYKYFVTMIPKGPSYKIMITSPQIMTPPKQGKATVVELVLFNTKPAYTVKDVTAAASAINPILNTFDGYICRKLSLTEDGQWMDLVYWTDLQSAEKASKQIMENTLAQEYFNMIDDKTMQFEHLDVVIDTER